MKKPVFLIILLLNFNCFCQNAIQHIDQFPEEKESSSPEEVTGIWKGKDRYVFLGEENQIAVILKTYYDWYYEISAVSENLQEPEPRDHNNSSSWESQQPWIEYRQLAEEVPAWEMTIHYDRKTQSIIPFCLVDDKIYTNFLFRPKLVETFEQSVESDDGSETQIVTVRRLVEHQTDYGFWHGVNSKENIKISMQKEQENLSCFYITEDSFYRLRYWQTDMEYEPESEASFNVAQNVYRIPKHLISGGIKYTCATGKRGRIRNINRFTEAPENFVINSDKTIITLGKPVLQREKGDQDFENLVKIVKEADARRKPLPPSPFHKRKVNWHWDLIWNLEKYNSVIMQVRNYDQVLNFMKQETD